MFSTFLRYCGLRTLGLTLLSVFLAIVAYKYGADFGILSLAIGGAIVAALALCYAPPLVGVPCFVVLLAAVIALDISEIAGLSTLLLSIAVILVTGFILDAYFDADRDRSISKPKLLVFDHSNTPSL